MKIVICGSMTASKEMVAIEKNLQELGHKIVLPDFTYDYANMNKREEMHTEAVRNKVAHDLIRGYFEEIKNSDAVLIVNIGHKGIEGYIGGNTFLEMGFAYVLNKPLYLLNKIPEMGYKDELEAMQPIILNGDLTKII